MALIIVAQGSSRKNPRVFSHPIASRPDLYAAGGERSNTFVFFTVLRMGDIFGEGKDDALLNRAVFKLGC
jgi:hypothetical protein